MLVEIERNHDKSQNACKSPSIRALELSIYFMALCSISDTEGNDFGFDDRASLVERYRDATERAISQADLYQHPSVTLLQAFAIFLVRSYIQSIAITAADLEL